MKVKYIPFWFADIIKTEERLSEMAARGDILTDFRLNGKFTFEEGEPQNVRYRIVPSRKCGGRVPPRLAEYGWEQVCAGKSCYVVKGDKLKVESGPVYNSWVTFYRAVQVVMYFVICYFVGFIIGSFVAAAEDKSLPAFLITVLLHLILFAVSLYIAIRAHVSNKKILAQSKNAVKFSFTIPEGIFRYTPEEEKQMLKDKTMIKRSPLSWISAPDKAEQWVEKMAAEGWKFYRLDKMGTTFYFVKSEPCRLKFVIDYQDEISDQYIDMIKSDGWKLEFATFTRVQGYCIWTKVCADDDDGEFYTDGDSALRQAKNYMLKMILPMILVVLLYGFILFEIITGNFSGGWFDYMFAALSALCIISYGMFAVRSLMYYIRLRKKYNK
ncbi:MAG: DUF2812 domain-containing protein [Oscillospiraceae bacterium]